MITVYMTFSNEAEARSIGQRLLDERLVSCIQLFPIKSSYWWNDKIENADEIAMFAKSKNENFQKIRDIVKSMHSYQTPEIIAFKIYAGDKEYLEWIGKEVEAG